MNKYQKALMEVEEIAYKQYEDACYNKTTKALAMGYEQKLKDNTKILQELVDKATGQKKHIENCKEREYINHNYCYACGQKLDWRVENE